MAWAETQPLLERAFQAAANLGLGIPATPGAGWLRGPLALVPLVVVLARRRGSARVPAAAPLLLGLALLAPLVLYSGSALLPDRTALVFLPFVALVLAEARPPVPAAAGVAAAIVLAASLPGWMVPLRGNIPNVFAARVEAASTNRCRSSRPRLTPYV